MRHFDYSSATSVDETIQLLGQDGNGMVKALAGGTDLLTLMKADIAAPSHFLRFRFINSSS